MDIFCFQMFLTCLLLTVAGFVVAAALYENPGDAPLGVLGVLVGGVFASLAWGILSLLIAIWTRL